MSARCPCCGEIVPDAEPGTMTCCADENGIVDPNVELVPVAPSSSEGGR